MSASSSPTFQSPLAVCPADGARMIGIGRTRFYELLNAREIPSFTLGRRRLILVEDLHSWLKTKTGQ